RRRPGGNYRGGGGRSIPGRRWRVSQGPLLIRAPSSRQLLRQLGLVELVSVQPAVRLAGGEQLGVPAHRVDPTAVQDDDPVRMENGRQPMGDDDRRGVLDDTVDRL